MGFLVTYSFQELRRRWARTALTALGLAAGVSLVVGIIGVSQALDAAQTQVLSPLRSVGTDVLVTRVVGATDSSGSSGSGSTAQNPAPGGGGFGRGPGGGGGGGGFFGGGVASNLNSDDASALLAENNSVVTDLSKLGKPGDHFTHDFFLPGTLLSFPDAALTEVKDSPGAASQVGGLSLLATHQTGTVPQIVAEIQTGGDTYTQKINIAPLTDAERQQVQDCLQAHQPSPAPVPSPAPSPGEGGGRRFDFGALQQCLPERLKQAIATFTTEQRTIRQALNPPQTDITSSSYNAAGVDQTHPDIGLITQAQVTKGRYFSSGATSEVLLNAAYASKHSLDVGGTLPINGTNYKIVGIVNPTLNGETADVYFPLKTLQGLAHEEGRVNMVFVKATNAAAVDHLAASIRQKLPGAQVVTAKSLADQVTGSLVDAKALADRLGAAVGVILLLGAFLIAVLLTLSSVAKRVREIGTLRAIGWSRGMVVRQLLAESLVIGVLGGVAGAILGLGVDALVAHLSPVLTASALVLPGVASSSLAAQFGPAAAGAAPTTGIRDVHLVPPFSPEVLLLAVVFAIVGGLLAGAVGGWRASVLRPAEALRDLG